MDELAKVAMTDKILNLSLELIAVIRVMAMVMVEATEFVFVVGDIWPHRGWSPQVLL